MTFDRNWRGRVARLGVTIAAFAATGAAATPALADPAADVSAFLSDVTIGGDGSPGKAVPLFVAGTGAVHPTVALDFSGLDGLATAEVLDDRCAVAGSTVTCSLPDTVEFQDVIPVLFRPVDGVADGAEGTIAYSTKADNVAEVQNPPVTLTVKDGIDLIAFPGEEQTVKPDDSYGAPVAFGNFGNQPAESVNIMLAFRNGVIPAEYSNCEYGQDSGFNGVLAQCQFDGPFPADGTVYELVGGFETTIAPDALGSKSVDFLVLPAGEAQVPTSVKLAHKGGKALTLTPRAAKMTVTAGEIDAQDNVATDELTVENGFDVAAIGATLTGAVGDTVTAKVGLKNVGAGSLDSRSGEPISIFTVAVPAGAEVVSAPAVCHIEDSDGTVHSEPGQPGGSRYRCTNPALFFGTEKSYLIKFGLKIKSLDAEAGAVSLDDQLAEIVFDDDNNANNTAPITISAGTAGGGSGGSGDTGGTGGGLPVTGVKVGAIAGGGAALLAAGAVLLLLSRRRRAVPAVDNND